MNFLKRSAFTLIEMLVVITIISILSSMVLVSFNKFKEKGREIQCISNLKNLHGVYMVEASTFLSNARYNATGQWWDNPHNNDEKYRWQKGWINRWNVGGAQDRFYNWWDRGTPSGYRTSDRGIWAITNGTLYEKAGHVNMKIFLCPTFEQKVRDTYNIKNAVRSYSMNDRPQWKTFKSIANDGKGFSRYLLFSEMALVRYVNGALTSRQAIFQGANRYRSQARDGVLHLQQWSSGNRQIETPGIYHPGDKANAVFMDGHIEKITWSQAKNAGRGIW